MGRKRDRLEGRKTNRQQLEAIRKRQIAKEEADEAERLEKFGEETGMGGYGVFQPLTWDDMQEYQQRMTQEMYRSIEEQMKNQNQSYIFNAYGSADPKEAEAIAKEREQARDAADYLEQVYNRLSEKGKETPPEMEAAINLLRKVASGQLHRKAGVRAANGGVVDYGLEAIWGKPGDTAIRWNSGT